MGKSINKHFDICIVGGGAAGLAAGIAAARKNPSLSVGIIEKMEVPGKKIAISGNGRCNLSNVEAEDWERTSAFFSSLGLLTRTDKDGRVYPYSEDGRDVVSCLLAEIKALGIELITRRKVSRIEKTADGMSFLITAIFNKPKAHHYSPTDEDIIIGADAVLITTGGKSKPKLGTSGDGFALAKSLGHTVNRLIPVLTGVETTEDIKSWGLSGVREKCALSLYKENELVFSDHGEIQFTDYGISGIVVFDMTRFMNLNEGDKNDFYKYRIEIDFMPDFDRGALMEMLDNYGLSSWVKEPLADLISRNAKSKSKSKSKEEILASLKSFELHPKNLKGWDMAQVTRGGIPISEIDEFTCESKLIPGLYLAGEILDRDFKCGGFNLQHAWSTGIRAGSSMAQAFCVSDIQNKGNNS